MSQRVSHERINKFLQDISILPYDAKVIANKMNVHKTNYSKYINGRCRITNGFLQKFYAVFGDEIVKIRSTKDVSEEDNTRLEKLEEKLIDIEAKVTNIIGSDQSLSDEIIRLEDKLETTFEDRLSRIESFLYQSAPSKAI